MGKGSVYPRGNVLWLQWFDEAGNKQAASSGLRLGQEAEAEELLAEIRRKVEAKKKLGLTAPGPLTVRAYGVRWIADRRDRGIGSADDDEARLKHAAGLEGLLLRDVRPGHIRDLIRELTRRIGPAKTDLAPRTVRHVYGVLHRMFEDARADELVPANPCALKRGDLPRKVDKNPLWRSQAVFTRQEIEQLISDARIPEERRVLYAILFIAGLRIGEAAGLYWRAYDPACEPLGKLVVAVSYNRKKKKEKAVKTDVPREVPVHPVLAKALAGWKLGGWERMMGRPPTQDDLLIPSSELKHLLDPKVLERFHADLATLGFRARRTHDTRRTFISLSLADGARKDILKWVTHGRPGDIVDDYTTLPWPALCEEVAKLNISLREGRLMQLPQVVGGAQLQSSYSDLPETKKARKSEDLRAISDMPRAGFEPASTGISKTSPNRFEAGKSGPGAIPSATSRSLDEPRCSSVAVPISVLSELVRLAKEAGVDPKHPALVAVEVQLSTTES